MFTDTKHIVSDQRNSIKNIIIKLLECMKSQFSLSVITEQDLYGIVGNLNEEGAMEALEVLKAMN